jgi:transcriptional regulator with GAF, ATPase, and Fis domain
VNCGALTRDLFASQLFGHVKGSFTGATESRPGLIAGADHGTLFLDEIGDLSYNAQATLLRFLQEGEVMPIGSTRTVKPDVRVVSATNRDLKTAIARGRFRNDLYQRLNAFPLDVPPLRDRPDDIPELVSHFVEKFNSRYGERVTGFTPKAMARSQALPWGGIRVDTGN